MNDRRRGHLAALGALILVAGCRSAAEKEKTEPVRLDAPESTSTAPAPPEAPPAMPVAPSGPPDGRTTYYVPLEGNEPQRGPDDALFTIVAFGDYQCPYCKKAEPVLRELQDKHPDDVRIVWVSYPIPSHLYARPAATAALEAHAQQGDEGFLRMHDLLFENQLALGRPDLERYAKQLGLNMEEFRAALETDKYAGLIDRQVALGDRLGVPGTPAFFMNGRFVPSVPLKTWEGALQVRRPLYERVVQSGVPKSQLYDAIMASAKGAP